jgi:para-aminobenzoate synthetase component 1
LEALGPCGWGCDCSGDGPGVGLLGLEPEIVFAGGFAALAEARRWLADLRASEEHAAVLIGGIDYELGAELAGGRLARAGAPAVAPVRLAGFRAVYRYDWRTRTAAVAGTSKRAVADLVERLSARVQPTRVQPSAARPHALPRWIAETPDHAYRHAVERVKAYIRAGDVYQVNLSRRLVAPRPANTELRRLFGTLASRAGAPFSAYLETPERTVLSASPERFLRVTGDRVVTCPIKGTRPRGRSEAEDARLRKELEASAKDRAEHMMIVDLERNDLGRVCRTGSVRVARLCEPRSYSDVHHLVFEIEGRLRDPRDWPALLEATFPGGSITGAPKLRAMQVIAELESAPRGLYTGALGVFDSAGEVDLSISIRAAVAEDGLLKLQLGGGIVADSDPDEELRETRDKGRAFARSWGFPV